MPITLGITSEKQNDMAIYIGDKNITEVAAGNALESAKQYADQGDASTLTQAQTYTNDREESIRTDYAEADATTLKSAQAYADNNKVDKTAIGVAGGVAELDDNGLILSAQLPSYVDDVLEYDSLGSFPASGEAGKIYVAKDSNLTYRWSGSGYVEISPSLALGETSSTAYRGDRGKTAYDHSQIKSGNPHGTTFTSLPDKPNALPANGGNADSFTDQAGTGNKKIWTGTEDELALISSRDANTIYLVFKNESDFLSVSPNTLSFSGMPEDRSIQIKCNPSLQWSIIGLPEGWTATPTSGVGPATVTIHATKSETASEGSISVSGGGMTATVNYTQAAFQRQTVYLVLVKSNNGCYVRLSLDHDSVDRPVEAASNVSFLYDSATHTSAYQYTIEKGKDRWENSSTDYIEQGTPYPENASIWFEGENPQDELYTYEIGDILTQ